MTVQVSIMFSGRLSLRDDIRNRMGLPQSDMVYVVEIEGGVMLRTVPQIVAHAQALAKQYADAPGSSITDFVAARTNETGE